MSETEKLVLRIEALSERMAVEPTTLSRRLLGNGKRLSEIKAGGSVTMATYSRVCAEVERLETEAGRR